MKKRNLTVTISRTVQIAQYEPLTVQLSESYDYGPEDDVREARKRITKSLASSIVSSFKEIKRGFEG